MAQGFRKLRNGLLHLGLTDVPIGPSARLSLTDVIGHYTGATDWDAEAAVDRALGVVAGSLEDWCMAAPLGGRGILSMLQHPSRA